MVKGCLLREMIRQICQAGSSQWDSIDCIIYFWYVKPSPKRYVIEMRVRDLRAVFGQLGVFTTVGSISLKTDSQ